jgi:hypothetical protein
LSRHESKPLLEVALQAHAALLQHHVQVFDLTLVVAQGVERVLVAVLLLQRGKQSNRRGNVSG